MNYRHKLLSLAILLSLTALVSAQDISIGGGLAYNGSQDVLGLNLRAYKNIGPKFCFGPEVILFAPIKKTINQHEVEKRILEFNVNAHYVFELDHHFGVFPIIGFNYTVEREKIFEANSEEFERENHDFFGLNLGAGLHCPFQHFIPFLEYEYVLSELKEHIISIGLFIPIGHASEHENEESPIHHY